MKRFRYPMTLLLASALTLSCSDRVLEKVSPNAPTVETYWRTADDAVQGVNAAYSSLQQMGVDRWPLFLFDIRSDEGYSQSPWPELSNLTKYLTPNYNLSILTETWRDHYRGLNRTNQVTQFVPQIQMDEALKRRLVAEAKFIRAVLYYNLALLWGNVPLVLTPQTPNDRPEQVSEAEIWAQIEKDLTEAKADLPAQYTGADIGRATKGAATAMLGKVLLQQRKWAPAAAQLKEVVDSQLYDLVPNYADNFTRTNENNKESVFEVQYSDVNRGDEDEAGGTEGSERAQFFGARDIGWSDGQPTKWLYNQFLQERTAGGGVDPRLDVTMWYYRPSDPTNIIYGRTFEQRGFGPNDRFWKKYQNNYASGTENYFSPINNRMIRFADVLLMYAEALNETGQTAQAIPLVNRVRARVNMPPLPLTLSKAEFTERLRHERVVELAGESVRWADMKRYGILGPEIAGPDAGKKIPANISDYDTEFENFVKGKSELLPIPTSERDANPTIDQNPNW